MKKLAQSSRLRQDYGGQVKLKTQSDNLSFKSYYLIIFFIGLLILSIGFRRSLFFQKKDRLNVVFYGEKTAFYSLGFEDGVDYFIGFPADIKIPIPGEFGYYRLGGLGKLVSLEKKPDLYKKSFSAVTSSFVDFYFYPQKADVYFGKEKPEIFLPDFRQFFIYRSNASLIDRAYIFFLFTARQKSQFSLISQIPVKTEADSFQLDERIFSDRLTGNFYQKTYRTEKMNVQIIYMIKEKNALFIARMIEGQGIRVVDFSYDNENNKCVIIETEKTDSRTAKNLKNFFNCRLTKGKTEPYDIILKLGEKEKEWAVE